jgi:hypothetical protein
VSGGVRLYAPGARLVSTRQVAGVVEAVGYTVAARGIGCVYGDTGLGKTVAVEPALHLLSGRVPVWRAVVGVRPGLPQVRAALCAALGLPSGSLTHRAGPADRRPGGTSRDCIGTRWHKECIVSQSGYSRRSQPSHLDHRQDRTPFDTGQESERKFRPMPSRQIEEISSK